MGRQENTIKSNLERFRRLAKLCNDFNNPEEVKEAIATVKWANSTKQSAVTSYTVYLRILGKTWTPPKYIRQEKIYFIPTEEEINALINASNKKLAPLLQMLKETGARIGELFNLAWIDLDLEHKTISINHPEKGSLPRILKISDKLKGMVNNLPRQNDKVFRWTNKRTNQPITLHGLRVTFNQTRARTAKKLNNPRLKQIHFHTFRHWKATTHYHKLRDERLTRHILGHRTASMTDRYIHIVETLYQDETGEWTSKAVQTKEEAMQLINDGWTKADEIDGYHIYRKRK